MKNTIFFVTLLSVAMQAIAQRGQEKLPVTYKIEAVKQINADIYQLAFNPQKNEVYVAGPKGEFKSEKGKYTYPDKQYVYVLDGSTLNVKDSIALKDNYPPLGVGFNTKTQTIYVGHSFNQAITAIDLKNGKQTLIPSGNDKSKIREVVVDEAANLIYVSDHGDPSVWVVDGKTNTYKTAIAAKGAFPTGLVVDHTRNRVYTTDGSGPEGNVIAFDSKTLKESGKWKTWGSNPLNVAVDSRSNRLFISENGDNKVSVLNATTGELITKISLGKDAGPVGLVYDETRDVVYVAERTKKEIAVLDVKNYKLTERIPTEGLANTIVLDKTSGAIYVTNKAPFSWTGKAEVLENGNTVMKIVKM
jgi:DNA-binding beta-propeller fold protein YncE